MTDENSWVFDSLICFLHGPIWNGPLQTFIEEKSLIFDPNVKLDESNTEYSKVHEEYKNLVDFMLGSFMEEIQINPEQFELACMEGRNQQQPDNLLSFHQGLFQQIWAANDIKIFIRMMTQRNVELQLQALDLIERKHSFNSNDDHNLGESSSSKDVEFSQCSDIKNEDLNKAIEEEISGEIQRESNNKTNSDDDKKVERLNLFFENKQISPEEIELRQKYLRTQRDKILEIKKSVRSKQLNDSISKNVDRPSSAQIAKKFLDGENVNDIPSSDEQSIPFQLRKTLAKRLRSEVVEKK